MIYENVSNDFSDRMDEKVKAKLVRNFSRSPNYSVATLNKVDGTQDTSFPIRVAEKTYSDEKIKVFESHPNNPVNFGDIIELSNETLIVTEISQNRNINQYGTLARCNQLLKWKFDGVEYSQKCNIVSKSARLDDTGRDFTFTDKDIVVYTQATDSIKNIEINQDFIFGDHFKNAYKLIDADDSSKDGLLILSMERVVFSQDDNLDDNVADNPNADGSALRIDSQLDDTYYLVTPKTAEIRSDSNLSISIEHYDSLNNLIATNFSYSVTGLNIDDYTLTVIDNNTVEITNNNGLGQGILEITDTDSTELLEYPIELIGLW